MPTKKPLTPEQVRNSYEFKVLKRLIKDEFDFVTNIDIQDNKLNDYDLVFLDLYVDPFKMAEAYDLKVWDGLFITTMFSDMNFESPFPRILLNDAPPDLSRTLDGELDDIIKSVRQSNVIPNNKKLPEPRSFKVGTWIVPKDTNVPKDYLKELLTKHPYLINTLRDKGRGYLVDNL